MVVAAALILHAIRVANALTVGLLESGTGTWTAELLGLATTVVGNEEGTVELGQGLLEQVLGVLIDELLVIGDQGLGDCLSDSAVHMSVLFEDKQQIQGYEVWYPGPGASGIWTTSQPRRKVTY